MGMIAIAGPRRASLFGFPEPLHEEVTLLLREPTVLKERKEPSEHDVEVSKLQKKYLRLSRIAHGLMAIGVALPLAAVSVQLVSG